MPALEARLDEISLLKRKYGNSAAEILNTLERLRKEEAELSALDAKKEELLTELAEAKTVLVEKAGALRSVRQKVAADFSGKLVETLKTLNFQTVSFEASVTETNRYTVKGADEVGFYLSANLGEPLRPLYKVASGGELSRIMLAVKTITVGKKAGGSRTLIFDEVDTGISGRTASEVGFRLSEISEKDQVILISHLPQIVSLADRHFRIEKSVRDGETLTDAVLLSEEESVLEVARLIGTGEVTEANTANALEMKARKQNRS